MGGEQNDSEIATALRAHMLEDERANTVREAALAAVAPRPGARPAKRKGPTEDKTDKARH